MKKTKTTFEKEIESKIGSGKQKCSNWIITQLLHQEVMANPLS